MSIKNQQGIAHLAIIIIAAGLLLVAGFFLVKSRQNATESSSVKTSEKTSNSKSCDASQPLFTAAFTDLDKIQAIGPLGGVGGGSPGRSYITVKEGMETAVYNPGNAKLETTVYARRGGTDTPGEYGLYFKADCQITYLLDHIHRVTDEIRALAPKEPAETSATQFGTNPNKDIKAGELLGYTKGTPLARTFDFFVENKSKKAYHVNQERWDWDQTIYAVCPYDLYTDELKSKFYALLGIPSNTGLQKADDCGNVSQDVDGTASGGWFQGDSTTNKGKWLAIGKQFSSAQVAIRENAMFGFSLTDYSPSVLPDKLTAGNKICYDGYPNSWAYINLVSSTQLSMATGSGSCPSAFPSNQAELWER